MSLQSKVSKVSDVAAWFASRPKRSMFTLNVIVGCTAVPLSQNIDVILYMLYAGIFSEEFNIRVERQTRTTTRVGVARDAVRLESDEIRCRSTLIR